MDAIDIELGHGDTFSDLRAKSLGMQHVQSNLGYVDGEPHLSIEYASVSTMPQRALEVANHVKDSVLIPDTGLVIAPMSNFISCGISREQSSPKKHRSL